MRNPYLVRGMPRTFFLVLLRLYEKVADTEGNSYTVETYEADGLLIHFWCAFGIVLHATVRGARSRV